jgi:chemotaxis protein CheD
METIERTIIINIGDVCVSRGPVIFQTVLGSCIAVCIWDEVAGIGGMNHFMVPLARRNAKGGYCGPEATAMLVRKMLDAGARMENLKAKIFGGGKVIRQFSERLDVGKENALAARNALRRHGIPIVKELTCTDYGIKVKFHSDTGRAYVKQLGEMN